MQAYHGEQVTCDNTTDNRQYLWCSLDGSKEPRDGGGAAA